MVPLCRLHVDFFYPHRLTRVRRILLASAVWLSFPCAASAQRNADFVLDSAALASGGGQSLVSFLAGRVPGLAVHGVDGTPAKAMRVTTAGAGGARTTGEPLLFVDGVLLRDDPAWSLQTINLPASLGWGLPVDDIAQIRVVLGAASGADVPFGAPRGAVFVTTRRPEGAARRVRASVAVTGSIPTFDSRSNEGTFSLTTLGDTATDCMLGTQATGGCTALGRTSWAPSRVDGPFAPAPGLRIGVDATGPVRAWQYRASVRDELMGGALFGTGQHRIDGALSLQNAPSARLRMGIDARFAHLGGRQGTWETSPHVIATVVGPWRTDETQTLFANLIAQQRSRGFVSTSDRFILGGSAQWSVAGVEVTARASADEMVRRGDRLGSEFTGGLAERTQLRAAMPSRAASIGLWRAFAIAPALRLETGAGAHWMRTRFMDSREVPDRSMSWWNKTIELSSLYLTSHLRMRDRLTFGGGIRAEAVRGVEPGKPQLSTDFALDLLRRESARGRSSLRLLGAYGEASDHRSRLAESVPFSVPSALEQTVERRIALEGRFGPTLAATLSHSVHSTVDGSVCCRPSPFFGGPATPVEGVDWRTQASLLSVGWSGEKRWDFGLSALHRQTTLTRLPGGPFAVRFGSAWAVGWMEEGRHPIDFRSAEYSFADQNADGIIAPGEVTYSDEWRRLGSPDPRWLLAATGRLALGFGIEVGATLESRLGHVVFDEIEALRCLRRVCDALHEASRSLEAQAAATALRNGSRVSGFVHSADNLRLRELFVRVPVGRHHLRLASHQLLLHSRYPGGDPEAVSRVGAQPTGIAGLTQPIFPSVSVRLEIGY